MQILSYSRGAVLSLMALLVCGCLGRSETPRFYSLSPTLEVQESSRGNNPGPGPAVGLGPVRAADYLDDARMITRTGEHQVVKAEQHRWAGSLKNNIVHVLAENLGTQLNTDRIFLFPWRASVPLDYQVVVEILRLDGRLGESAILVARWSVLAGPEKRLLRAQRSSITEPVTGGDYAALAAAQSRALAGLSREIAQAIQGTSGRPVAAAGKP
ncbi:MAG: PqiC family protein [Syntrophobacterales bacterium]|nr:PqiC family protein [Syntrophobacterales bacterium]